MKYPGKFNLICKLLILLTGILITTQKTFSQFFEWKYQIPITIINFTGLTLKDYQVQLTIDTKSPISFGKMKPNGSDIRFTLDCNDNFLNYWIESKLDTNAAAIWVKVPEIRAFDSTRIYMIYGNTTAVYMSNVDSVFELFDHFDSTITSFSIECGSITPSFSGSNITFSWPTNGLYTSNKTFPDSTAYKVEAKVINCSGKWPGIFWKLAANGIGYSLLTNGTVSDVRIGKTALSGFCGSENWASNVFGYSNSAGIWEHTWVSTGNISSYFPSVGNITSSDTQYAKIGDLKVAVGGIPGGVGSIELDWIRIRKYASTEPNVTLGLEQGPVIANFTYIDSGLTLFFSDSSINASEYDWNFGDGNIDSAANPTHTFDTQGIFNVCLTVTKGCIRDSICKEINIYESSIQNLDFETAFRISPNPSTGKFYLELNIFEIQNIDIVIFDICGKIVIKNSMDKVSDRFHFLDLGHLKNGIYLIKINPYKICEKLVLIR